MSVQVLNIKHLKTEALLVYRDGRIWSCKTKRFLKLMPDKQGYMRVYFKNGSGLRKGAFVHRLLAQAFIPNPKNLPWINHIDGNKGNFALDNLEWCTPQENQDHAKRTGLYAKSAIKKASKNLARNEEIRKLCESGLYTRNEIGKMFNMTGVNVTNIYHGVTGSKYKPEDAA